MFWIQSLVGTFKALKLPFWVKKCHFVNFSERAGTAVSRQFGPQKCIIVFEKFFLFQMPMNIQEDWRAKLHCSVIIGRNPIEANANTVAIQLPGNPVAYIGKCFTPYQEFLQPLQVNYHLLANYPQKLKQFPVQAKGFADRSVKYLYYTYNLPIYIYSVLHCHFGPVLLPQVRKSEDEFC